MCQGFETLRPMESAVVVHPSAYKRVHELGHFRQGVGVPAFGQIPTPDGGPDCLSCFGTHGRDKADKHPPVPSFRSSRAKGVAQKVKRLQFVGTPTITVLTVDNLHLLGVQLQSAFLQPLPDCFQNSFGLGQAHAMDQGVVGITLEGNGRILPCHPLIKRIVHE
jgi:hypothetical protein